MSNVLAPSTSKSSNGRSSSSRAQRAMRYASMPPLELIYAKTDLGRLAIDTKHIRLPLVDRRVLLLIDGTKSGEDLVQFCVGKDVSSVLQELIDQSLVEVVGTTRPPPIEEPESDDELAGLPPASQRSAKEMEMARNLMVNTVNKIFPANTHVSLLKELQSCSSVQELRAAMPHWEETLSKSKFGQKHLPEFKKMLFAVL